MNADTEKQAKLDTVRKRAEKRLVVLARKAGLFDVRLSNAQIQTMFEKNLEDNKPHKQSQLYKLESNMQKAKRKQNEQTRRDDTRRKILLGSFIIAQMEHKPVLKAELIPELVTFLELHKDAAVVDNNKALLAQWIVN